MKKDIDLDAKIKQAEQKVERLKKLIENLEREQHEHNLRPAREWDRDVDEEYRYKLHNADGFLGKAKEELEELLRLKAEQQGETK